MPGIESILNEVKLWKCIPNENKSFSFNRSATDTTAESQLKLRSSTQVQFSFSSPNIKVMIPRTFCSFYQAYKSQMALIYPDVVGFTMIAFRDKNFTFSIGDGLSGRHVEQGSALVFNDSSSQRGDKKNHGLLRSAERKLLLKRDQRRSC